jgi:hypothetical protein
MLSELGMSKSLDLDAGTSSPLHYIAKDITCKFISTIYQAKMKHPSICNIS